MKSFSEEFQFLIQAQNSIFFETTSTCIVASRVDGEPMVRKLKCDFSSKDHFWRWFVSPDPAVDFSLLQNVGTGLSTFGLSLKYHISGKCFIVGLYS